MESRDNKIKAIKKAYKDYDNSLIFSVRDTGVGIWGTADIENVFSLFEQIGLHGSFLDLGSGDGRIVAVASLFCDAYGIEFDDELHRQAEKMKSELKLECTFIKGDFLNIDLSKYDYLFINPDKGFHHGLEAKLKKEMKGKLIVYNRIFLPRFLKNTQHFSFGEIKVGIYEIKQ